MQKYKIGLPVQLHCVYHDITNAQFPLYILQDQH